MPGSSDLPDLGDPVDEGIRMLVAQLAEAGRQSRWMLPGVDRPPADALPDSVALAGLRVALRDLAGVSNLPSLGEEDYWLWRAAAIFEALTVRRSSMTEAEILGAIITALAALERHRGPHWQQKAVSTERKKELPAEVKATAIRMLAEEKSLLAIARYLRRPLWEARGSRGPHPDHLDGDKLDRLDQANRKFLERSLKEGGAGDGVIAVAV